MLSITRQKNESFKIGDDITVVITRVGSKKVRIGIEAPRHLRIRRSEHLEQGPNYIGVDAGTQPAASANGIVKADAVFTNSKEART